MKPKSALRSFLALAGSSVLAISYSHGQTILADSYLTSLDVSSNTTLFNSLNFNSNLAGPLTGSANLTLTGFFNSQLSLINNGTGNTFDGNIIVDSGILRIAGNPFAAVGSQQGFTAPSMTSSDTITINRAGILTIDDNAFNNLTGYVANRFGSNSATAPAVNLAGGRLNLIGVNNASSSVQTLGDLTASSGYSIVNINRSAGTPTLTFDSLSISKGAVINFYSTLLGTGTNDARIKFTTAPTMINGIIAGAKVWNPATAGVGDFATYDNTNGVKVFTAYDVVSNDINTGTSATTNFAMTVATTPVTMGADRAVNALNYRANGGTWSLGGFKLTLTSGMFLRNGTNAALTINNGTLTAGNGTDAIDLHIFTAQQNVGIDAVIADNASSVVTLVKSHGNLLSLNGGVNNTYTGGTYVVDGTLTTGTVANRAYLGTGKVTVDGTSQLTLGNIGATSNSTGDDYTAINGGRIQIASGAAGAYTANDTFNIGANSVISGGSASNQGLASLTRGTNVTLAEDAIIGHDYILSTALNLTTGTIKSLGTNADLYYGFNGGNNQAVAGTVINIGTGTAFKGLALYANNGTFDTGTINVGSGTTDVYIKTNGANTAAPFTLTLGYDFFAGAGATINLADAGTLDVNVLGNMNTRDSNGVFGDTSTGRYVEFVATAGSNLQFGSTVATPTQGMGSGTGIASARIENGGSITTFSQAAALNGAVTVQAGGRFDAALAGGVTGSGLLTFEAGSILNITNATGFSGAQASAATINAGTIVKVSNGAQPGTSAVTLDSILGSKSPIYHLTGDVDVPEPAAAGTTTMTLNKNGYGVGGIVTNGSASAFFRNNVNGQVTIGANGGVMAATTGTELQVNENIEGTNVVLTFGTTAIIDGLPKLGTVALGSAAGSNNYTGENIINAGSVRQGYSNTLGAITNQLTVNTGGTMNLNGVALTVGNLTGTGGIINGGSTLTIGQGNNGGGNYQGSIQGTTALTKTGTATITLSGANSYTGNTDVNAGTLQLQSGASTITQTVGALRNQGGEGTLISNKSGAGDISTTFNGTYARLSGATGNIVSTGGSNGSTNIVKMNGALGFIDKGLYFGGSEFAARNALNGYVRALAYGSDTDAVAVNTITASKHVKIDADQSVTGRVLLSLNLSGGGVDWNNSSGNFSVPGIIKSGGGAQSVISGGTLTTASNAELVIRTDVASDSLNVTSQVTGFNGGLTKSGAGTLTLSHATNGYTGATRVNAGTLIVNGNISTSSLTTVAAGATLGGSGTIGKTIVNGTFAVGNSPGQMNFIDTLGLNGSTIMEIDGTSGAGVAGGHDFINLTGLAALGALTYGGTMTLDIGVLFVGGSYSWNLFDMASHSGTFTAGGITLADQYSGTLLDADLNGVWDLTSGDNTWQFTQSTGVLGLTVIPEPRAALLGGLGMLMLLRRRRA